MFSRKRFTRMRRGQGGGEQQRQQNGTSTGGGSSGDLDDGSSGHVVSPPQSPGIMRGTGADGELAAFDACVETCDALAASSSLVDGIRSSASDLEGDEGGGDGGGRIEDCSVRVSPDGFLIMLPSSHRESSAPEKRGSAEKAQDDAALSSPTSSPASSPPRNRSKSDGNVVDTSLPPDPPGRTSSVSSYYGDDDAESAIVVGYDVCEGNDRTANGFSCRGWSHPCTTLALRQCASGLQLTSNFAEELVTARKNCADVTARACRRLFDGIWDAASSSPRSLLSIGAGAIGALGQRGKSLGKKTAVAAAHIVTGSGGVDDATADTSATAGTDMNASASSIHSSSSAGSGGGGGGQRTAVRIGPLLQPGTTMHAALTALEEYHSKSAQSDARRWRPGPSPQSPSSSSNSAPGPGGSSDDVDPTSAPGTTASLPSSPSKQLCASTVLSSIRLAAKKSQERAERRERAMNAALRRADEAERRLGRRKADASRKWAAVREAEAEVRNRMEELRREAQLEREREAVRAWREENIIGQGGDGVAVPSGATSNLSAFDRGGRGGGQWRVGSGGTAAGGGGGNADAIGGGENGDPALKGEVWEMLNEMAENMDSFAPTGVPLPSTAAAGDGENVGGGAPVVPPPPPSMAITADGLAVEQPPHDVSRSSSRPPSPSQPPPPTRADVEMEFCVPQKKIVAMTADDAVDDAAGALLNALSVVDTVRRSARIAAEACMLSAANSQVRAIRDLVKIERASLEERLRNLEALEGAVAHVDVRADIDMYVEIDKRHAANGGRVNDDDDGGVASALAVLDCHSQGIGAGVGVAGSVGTSVLEGWGSEDESGIVSRDEIEALILRLFDDGGGDGDGGVGDKAEDGPERSGGGDKNNNHNDDEYYGGGDLGHAIDFLVGAVAERSARARNHRASVCHALNAQRSVETELKSTVRFDGLCQVLDALLRGCTRESGDIANAKMCMMLSQTFYIVQRGDVDSAGEGDGKGGADEIVATASSELSDRMKRTYVKSRLIGHPLWLDDDFWDQALFQCVSESLTQSRVMSNLQRAAMVVKFGSLCDESGNAKDLQNIKWHDFLPEQREEAALQLHAVIFAQLGALAHSMVEFGCSFDRAVAFVRRLSVRHQLPINQRTMLLQHLKANRDTNTDAPPVEARGNDEIDSEKTQSDNVKEDTDVAKMADPIVSVDSTASCEM